MAHLAADGILYHFGRRMVLRGVSLAAGPGDCQVLFGINGAGKSTLLNILSTRYRLQHGRYLLDGHDASKDAESVRGALLYVGHHTHLYGHLTSLENLRFFADLRGISPAGEELKEAIAAAGLAKAMDRPVRGFSAGMRKRLALARMLLIRPSLLLLDEPYSALDADGVAWLNARLRDYLARGGTLFLATHDPERVAALSPKPLRLVNGRLAEPAAGSDAPSPEPLAVPSSDPGETATP
ncbi:MAG: heme ABC exporter ATP-binding protein CcmA [Magnetococcales bacterium]|nr:heme ABC exporter ATP-binding protein CcmA [Magnetococcales bacterium]